MATPGTYDRDGNLVERSRAMVAWVGAARPVLEQTAQTYNATITYGDLAHEVQERTGIFTRQLVQNWAGDLAYQCCRPDEPLLCSLVVDKENGVVGPGYLEAVLSRYGGPDPTDLQMSAAAERWECYKHFGAELPPNGGEPTLTRQVARRRQEPRRIPRAITARRPLCPEHFIELTPAGVCDICE